MPFYRVLRVLLKHFILTACSNLTIASTTTATASVDIAIAFVLILNTSCCCSSHGTLRTTDRRDEESEGSGKISLN